MESPESHLAELSFVNRLNAKQKQTSVPKFVFRVLLSAIVAFAFRSHTEATAQVAGQNATIQLRLGWKQLKPLPDKLGVAGAYAGISNGRLLAAGGANFPDLPPWVGGVKVWHDRVWAMDLATGEWAEAGKLPRPLGYGVSISTDLGLICIGGSDLEKHYRDCLLLSWIADGVQAESLPDLPRPLANAAGAMVGSNIYVCGGTETPDAKRPLAALWRLDLSAREPTWEQLDDCPGGPRLLPAAGSDADSFYLFGGADLKLRADGKTDRVYRRDAWVYSAGKGWRQLADLPVPVVASPSPAPLLSSGEILLLSGDSGEHVGFQPPHQHPGFSKKQFLYNPSRNEWRTLPEESPVSRVTAPLVRGAAGWLLISGEQRPGVRSPEVWQIEEQH